MICRCYKIVFGIVRVTDDQFLSSEWALPGATLSMCTHTSVIIPVILDHYISLSDQYMEYSLL